MGIIYNNKSINPIYVGWGGKIKKIYLGTTKAYEYWDGILLQGGSIKTNPYNITAFNIINGSAPCNLCGVDYNGASATTNGNLIDFSKFTSITVTMNYYRNTQIYILNSSGSILQTVADLRSGGDNGTWTYSVGDYTGRLQFANDTSGAGVSVSYCNVTYIKFNR